MTKAVAKTGASAGALAAAQALRGNLAKVQAALPETRGSGFLGFGRDGVWSFGTEHNEVLPEDILAVNPMSIETGYICWTDRAKGEGTNEVLGEIMVPVGGDVPLKHTLPVHTDQKNGKVGVWKEQISCQMKFTNGPHEGVQVKFSTTSAGGIGAMRSILDQIMLQLDEDGVNIVPLITLGDEHYIHKQWGKIYTPVFKITDWMSLGGEAAVGGGEVDDDQPEAEAEAEADAATAASTEDEPVRRRRR